MSESSFPFETQPEPAGPEDESAPADSRKPLLAVGGLVAALALGASAFVFLGGGDEVADDLVVAPRGPAAAPPPAEPQQVAVVPVAAEDALGRNPFKALYLAPTGGAAAGAAATPEQQAAVVEQSAPKTGTTPTTITVVPLPGATPTPTPTQPTPAPTTPAPQPPPPTEPPVEDDGMRYPATLMELDGVAPGTEDRVVKFGYAGESFEVRAGQVFGRFDHLRVMQIVTDPVKPGVYLQLGDGTPFFVGLKETVYVL